MAKIPKPLSEKSIQRMLDGWDMKTVELIRRIYTSFANLYGVYPLWLAWDLLKTYGIKVKKKDFYAYSDIARREVQPYYVFEENELFSDEKPKVETRFIVNKEVFRQPSNDDFFLYNIVEEQAEKLFPYIPENLFDFYEADGIEQNPAWKRLCMLIRSLKTADGKAICEPDNSDFPSQLAQGYKAEYKKKRIETFFRRPLADIILEDIKQSMHIGDHPIRAFTNAAEIFHLEPTKKQVEKIIELIMEVNNTSNLWINFGWKPSELREAMEEPQKVIKLSELDSVIRDAVRRGEIDFKQMQTELAKVGITLIDE